MRITDFKLIQATAQDKVIIKNLMQFYMYDFSEFVEFDVAANGLFTAYKDLENYWEEPAVKFPYIIKKDENYAGFVLVKIIELQQQYYFSIAEFFIMKKYRRNGLGKAVATEIFNLHKGEWEVFQKINNKPAQLFWSNVINEYTNGNFTDRTEQGRKIQNFKN